MAGKALEVFGTLCNIRGHLHCSHLLNGYHVAGTFFPGFSGLTNLHKNLYEAWILSSSLLTDEMTASVGLLHSQCQDRVSHLRDWLGGGGERCPRPTRHV